MNDKKILSPLSFAGLTSESRILIHWIRRLNRRMTGVVVLLLWFVITFADNSLSSNPIYTNKLKVPSLNKADIYNFNARLYNPKAGRFLSPDPVTHRDWYVYASNNPIANIDPTGKAPPPSPLLSDVEAQYMKIHSQIAVYQAELAIPDNERRLQISGDHIELANGCGSLDTFKKGIGEKLESLQRQEASFLEKNPTAQRVKTSLSTGTHEVVTIRGKQFLKPLDPGQQKKFTRTVGTIFRAGFQSGGRQRGTVAFDSLIPLAVGCVFYCASTYVHTGGMPTMDQVMQWSFPQPERNYGREILDAFRRGNNFEAFILSTEAAFEGM